jgi:hypothetical protein
VVNRAKAKGTIAETALVGFLRTHGFGAAERRALSGSTDKGDVAGTPGLAWEMKSTTGAALLIPQWMREAAAERLNAGADYCPLVVKPRGMGPASVDLWPAILPLAHLVELLRCAGYGDPT